MQCGNYSELDLSLVLTVLTELLSLEEYSANQ